MNSIECRGKAALPMAELDLAFGHGGVAFISPANPYYMDMVVESVVTAADGTIYVCGTDANEDGTSLVYLVAAFNADGSPSIGFGDRGVVRRTFYKHGDRDADAMGNRVLLLDDGNLLVFGGVEVDSGSGKAYFAMAKMDRQGRLISDFGDSGNLVIPLLCNGEEYQTRFVVGLDIALHGGWLYVAASLNKDIPGEEPAFHIYTGLFKVSLDGIQDQAFGNNGMIITSGPSMREGYTPNSIVIAEDRLTVIGTDNEGEIAPYRRWVMMRYLLDGKTDGDFGKDGRILDHEDPVNFVLGTHLLRSTSGHLLAHVGAGLGQEGRMLRVAGDQLDASFGEAGVVRIPPVNFAGFKEMLGERRMIGVSAASDALARLLPTGNLDPEFGENGYASVRLPSSSQRVNGVVIDCAGGAIVYGQLGLDGVRGSYLARYLVR